MNERVRPAGRQAERDAGIILVTGGTGTLGRPLVARLREAGRQVRVLSRHEGEAAEGVERVTGDLIAGEGVDAAVGAAEVIVHCAGTRGAKDDEVQTRNLVAAAARAGRPHLVFISVVGADRVPVEGRLDRAMFGYFAAKLRAERTIADSRLPWTTLRATQFHDLVLETVQAMTRLPVVPVPPGMRFQPIDAGEVADRLAELALGEPAGLAPDVAGPREYELAEIVRGYLRAAGKRRPILPLPLPGKAARAVRAGAIVAADRAVGTRTWEEFLAHHLGS
jgi:uncharacterized protein YbjT (DUF2867 family)